MSYMLAWGMPGLSEWIIIGAIGLLLFGKRLPEVGRSIGRSIVEFKRGLKEAENAVMNEESSPAGGSATKGDPQKPDGA